ncbi:MAG TPA: hypothetical protein VLM05_08225, partial [Mycobacteriales bacterium]|nr:hypothetical protein [Mycobacteriales bacterium]
APADHLQRRDPAPADQLQRRDPAPADQPQRRNGNGSPADSGRRLNEASPNGRIETPSDTGKLDPAGDGDLVRRVPGAQMPAGARGAKPEIATGGRRAGSDPAEHRPAELAPELDAVAARSLIEEFEAGVQRALQRGGDRGTAGTAETDEEDAR